MAGDGIFFLRFVPHDSLTSFCKTLGVFLLLKISVVDLVDLRQVSLEFDVVIPELPQEVVLAVPDPLLQRMEPPGGLLVGFFFGLSLRPRLMSAKLTLLLLLSPDVTFSTST